MQTDYSKRAEKYARDVVAGKVAAGSNVVAACQRHLNDLISAHSGEFDYRFDGKRGNLICDFAERMVHIKGKWARTTDGSLPTISLEDWQCFVLAVPFGWVRKTDGLRRFREIYDEIPRKNAKSTLGAIIGLYMAFCDHEPGAEVFSGATSMDQALAVFKTAWLMVKRNPEFQEHFGLDLGGTEQNPGPIVQLSTGSRFAPIIGKPGDGDSPHCAIIDEYHEHATSIMYDAMKTGMGSRTQPMRVIITTAGVDTSGPCYDKHLEAEKILNRTLEADDVFTVIFAAEPECDWKDFAVWKTANPNYGVSVMPDFLKTQHRDAMQKPSQQNVNLTKHLGLWRNAGMAWMNMAKWDACKDESLHLEDFANARCWLATDLANKIDIASLAYIFEAPFGWALFCKHYLPEATIESPENDHYRKWRDDPHGWITQTDGAITDFARIEDDIADATKMFSVQALAFDQKESGYLINNIQQKLSIECIDVPQSPAHISEPMKEMEAVIYAGEIRHCGDPVLTWMMGNVVKKAGRGGGELKSYYPTKQNSRNKIDGVVAAIMALSRAKMAAKPKKYQMIFI